MKNNNKIHVLYILTKLELGGAQKVCLSLLKGIKDSGHKSILISGSQGILVTEAKKIGSTYFLDSFKREISFKNIFFEIKTFIQLIRKIKELKKKYPKLIIHTHSTKAGILGRWAAFFSGIKNRIHTIHGFGFHEHQNKIIWTIIYLAEYLTSLITTHYVCVSKYDIEIGKKYLHKFDKKYSLIRAAVEWEKFYLPATKVEQKFKAATKTNNFYNQDFTIGTISCFKPQKNLFDLLKAFKSLKQKISLKNLNINLNLEIIGDGELRPKIEEWIYINKLTNNIKLLGWQNDTANFLQKWKLFAMSSLWEGLPCAIIEARLSKLPVIAYNISGIPEVVLNNKNGFLIETNRWDILSKKMEYLILNTKKHRQLSIYPDNLDDFKNFNMIRKHINLYKQIVK